MFGFLFRFSFFNWHCPLCISIQSRLQAKTQAQQSVTTDLERHKILVIFSKGPVLTFIKSITTDFLVHLVAMWLLDKMMPILPEQLLRHLKDQKTTYVKWLCTYVIKGIVMFLTTMITSAIFGHFSTDLIVSSIKHSIMNLPRQFLATFLMDKMMQTVPEELRTYLKVEWMPYIKWLCTYAIEEILMRLMKTIASALQ